MAEGKRNPGSNFIPHQQLNHGKRRINPQDDEDKQAWESHGLVGIVHPQGAFHISEQVKIDHIGERFYFQTKTKSEYLTFRSSSMDRVRNQKCPAGFDGKPNMHISWINKEKRRRRRFET